MWGRGPRGNNAACSTLCWFSVTSPTTHKQLGPSGTDSWVGGLVYVLGPCGSLQWTLLWDWKFLLLLPQPTGVFSQRFEALFPCTWTLGCTVCLTPQLFLPVYLHASVGPPTLQSAALSALAFQPPPCCESSPLSCLSPTLLPVWVNVSSLTCLLDFHTVWFSDSSGWFLFLNLLFFFWLCEEAQCVYLCPHLGQKSEYIPNVNSGYDWVVE